MATTPVIFASFYCNTDFQMLHSLIVEIISFYISFPILKYASIQNLINQSVKLPHVRTPCSKNLITVIAKKKDIVLNTCLKQILVNLKTHIFGILNVTAERSMCGYRLTCNQIIWIVLFEEKIITADIFFDTLIKYAPPQLEGF